MNVHNSKYFALPVNAMGKLQGRGIFLYDLRRALIIPEKSIPEKRVLYCMYVGSIVAYQDYQNRCRPHKKDFSHMWDWVRMRTILLCQTVEIHGWLLSGSEELTILNLLLFFDLL